MTASNTLLTFGSDIRQEVSSANPGDGMFEDDPSVFRDIIHIIMLFFFSLILFGILKTKGKYKQYDFEQRGTSLSDRNKI